MNTILKNSLLTLSLVGMIALISSCASHPSVSDDIGEPFVLERDLVGKTIATGSFSAIDGTFREFVAYIDGTHEDNQVTLVEDFEYSDGVKERKTWVLTKLPNGEYRGVREDIVGTARGYQDGKVFRLEYDLAIPNEDGTPGRTLRFRDVLYNQPDGVIMNEATVGLWGFRVANVNLQIKRQ
ncbi:MAG: DUF3833 family protein [Granulosicoccus sp.]